MVIHPEAGKTLSQNIAAVIVHHRSYASLENVVEALLSQGISPGNLVVLDNSEEPDRRQELRLMVRPGVEILYSTNNGYGAAVNYALDYFEKRSVLPQAFLVATHEVRPAPGAVQLLWKVLEATPAAAVTGPTLVSGAAEEFVWSTGGYLHKLTGVPGHYDHRAPIDVLSGRDQPERRQWLDGAFLLYRWEDISARRLPEHYFLYMEETDLHTQFYRHGREVVWVPGARVWQDSKGIPPFYFARNMSLFLDAHGGKARAVIVPTLAVTRKIIGDVVKGKGLSNAKEYLRGMSAAKPWISPHGGEGTTKGAEVLVINPLGAALHHYEVELQSVLRDSGVSVRTIRFLEPSASDVKAVRWIITYLWVLIQARFDETKNKYERVLVLWPVLGFFDLLILGALGFRNVSLVMHDPEPLVRSVGYSNWTKRVASKWGSQVQLVAQSEKAENHIRGFSMKFATVILPHPILEPREIPELHHMGRPKICVLGQYKADRDLEVLAKLAEDLREEADLEVHGRGWPEIDGWRVVKGFVPEHRLDQLIRASSVVVIPYKKFFQSGIAIRAFELGRPFVGPKESVLADMLGKESLFLVANEEGTAGWSRAVSHAVKSDTQQTLKSAKRWRAHNVKAWSAWARR